MKRSTKYVGLDVHQATTVACVRDERARVIARDIFPTEESAFLAFFSGIRGSVHVAFEEGTQAQSLYDLLVRKVDRVVVCDRRGEAKEGNNPDRVARSNSLVRRDALEPVVPDSPGLGRLRGKRRPS